MQMCGMKLLRNLIILALALIGLITLLGLNYKDVFKSLFEKWKDNRAGCSVYLV